MPQVRYNLLKHSSPIDKHEIHRKMVWEKYVHEEQRSQMEDYTQPENYQSRALEEDRERERKLP